MKILSLLVEIKNRNITYIFLMLLFSFQIILGYFFIKSSYFIAQNYIDLFYWYSYVVTFIAISYTIFCYIITYFILKNFFPSHINHIQLGLIIFYILSLISYTFVSGSYSPFFLIGIKLAQNQI